MISITDLDDRFIFVNQAFLANYGYTMREVIGQTPALIADAAAKPREQHVEVRLLASAGNWTGELLNRRKDGSFVWVELTGSLVRQPGGAPRLFHHNRRRHREAPTR